MFASFIDLKKALKFDFVDRDMLLYKLLLNNIDGKLYNSIKSIYAETSYCHSGVKQGDNCSPTLFSIFVDDLVLEVNALGLAITVDDIKISILLYADVQ